VGILESVKEPLEGRIWYEYAGQSHPSDAAEAVIVEGSSNKPIHVGRVLDDGSTQLYTFEYNDFGHVTKKIDPVGRTISYIYADNGIDLLEERQTRVGQNELLSKMTYNSKHRPLTKKDVAGQTTTYTYNDRGQLLTETNARGDTTTNHYDTNGYRRWVDGPVPSGIKTEWTYDTFGRIRTKTDDPTTGYILTYDYDDFDHLTKVTYPDGTFEQYIYIRLDIKEVQDRAKRQTSFEYNSNRQMTKQTDPLNRVTRLEWCKCGALRRLTDPMGRSTTWRHDVQGRVKSKEYTDGSKITYLYENRTSRISQKIDEKLQVTQYKYNLDNTLSRKSYADAAIATPAVAFTYDANYFRMTSMTDGTGTTHYSYIPITPIPTLGAGQLRMEVGPLPKDTIAYEYDQLGRRVSTSINGGIPAVVVFDEAGRVGRTTNALGEFIYEYDPSSLRKSLQIYPNGQTARWSYAGILLDQRLEAITYKHKDAPISDFPISELVYEYDVPERRIRRITQYSQRSDVEGAFTYDFGYDDADQLKSSTVYQGANIVSSFGYTYDRAGNRLTEEIKGTTPTTSKFSYNALNELTSSDGASGYQLATYGWDAEHRLVSVKSGNSHTEFRYDGFGRCVIISHWVDGSEVTRRLLIWSGAEICEERSKDGAVSKRFFEQGMQLIDGPTTNVFFYTRDHLDSIREMIHSSTGNVVTRYAYDPFGRQTRLEGGLDADFGFAGMFWLPDSGLNLTLFRAYDPGIGRWLSRDPLQDAEVREGINVFTYVKNNPVNLTDPFGLTECEPTDPFKCYKDCIGDPRLTERDSDATTICFIAAGLAGIGGYFVKGLIGGLIGGGIGLFCVVRKSLMEHSRRDDCRRLCPGTPYTS
jgi:RHS repeat-associated protein